MSSGEIAASVFRQSFLWLNGKPEHNPVTDECCLDFSCCRPDLFVESKDERMRLFLKEQEVDKDECSPSSIKCMDPSGCTKHGCAIELPDSEESKDE
jgi:hypothetical protein